ncbi:cation transporter [Microbacterium sp. LWO14-1.2]|uniref:heavy-metal-associated domain-containing protein n=1 Tax=unclassified Microbacterium TaxID=2609290 RepID=UPI00313941ED
MTDRIELSLKDATAGCACCAAPGNQNTDLPAASAVTQEILVDGMTCSHCVSSVTEELTAIEGVDSITVALNAGGTSRVTINSRTDIDDDAITAAVEEAGYALSTPN